jgi:diguanylate cyclase (GGDEF)-like protein
MARRLAARPELFAVAADQYLPVVDDVHDPSERRRVARLLRQAAEQSMWIGESLPAERMIAAAVRLTDDRDTLIDLHTVRQAALSRLGRLDEADEAYQTVIWLGAGPYERLEAARWQISSLTNRNRPDRAIDLGLDLLRELGWEVPTAETIRPKIDRELDWCRGWIEVTNEADDLRRPDVTDPTVLAAGALMSRMMPACFIHDRVTMAWLALSAARAWAELGPSRNLIGVIGRLAWVLTDRENYRLSYRLMHRLLAVGNERDFEPDLSQVRYVYCLAVSHWFTPLEEGRDDERRAREGLLRIGDLQAASYTFLASVFEIDATPTIDEYAAKVEAAMSFAQRIGNENAVGIFQPYQWLVSALRGEPASAEVGLLADRLAAAEPVAAVNIHTVRALVAALFDDPEALARYSQNAMAMRSANGATYAMWHVHLLRAIALAERIRSSSAHSSDMAELDGIVDWVAQRAADEPTNFQHMLSLIEAERAWAGHDFQRAMGAFDSAARGARHRPWHRAFIAQRAAKFMLAHGLEHAAWPLLLEARQAYQDWGALAKVDQLDRVYPSLEIPTDTSSAPALRLGITPGAIDMLGILAASRALSSETTIGALRGKVGEVLSAMTGATDVGLFIRQGEPRRWFAARGDGDGVKPLNHDRGAPHSIMRYVERTREPLLVGDASHDDRFASDPYLIDAGPCSLLAVPVLSRGDLQAILLLENRLMRNAFSVERLEAATLVAGQLAVSLDNAQLYSSLERKVEERTDELARANERLEQLSVTDPLTGLANRRRLEVSLRDEWRRAQRSGAPLTVAMLDVDWFKKFNDRYGHHEGDRCLQRVAAEIATSVRKTDLVARYGGEEFAIVMPDTILEAGRDTAERVRRAISELDRAAPERAVTVSVGVATTRGTNRESTDQLLERADGALYQAKRAGRNRVCTSD